MEKNKKGKLWGDGIVFFESSVVPP